MSGGESVPAAVSEGRNVRRHGGLLGTVRGRQERRERTTGKTGEDERKDERLRIKGMLAGGGLEKVKEAFS